MQLAKNLSRIMKDRGLTLGKLSQMSGVSKPTLHGWTTGRRVLYIDQLKQVANVLKISIHELFYGEPDPFAGVPQDVLREIFSGDVRITIHRIERVKGNK